MIKYKELEDQDQGSDIRIRSVSQSLKSDIFGPELL